MTDLKQLRDEYVQTYGSSSSSNRVALALLDRAIAEDADGVDVSTVSVDKKTHYMKAVAMGVTLGGKYRPILVDDEGFVLRNHTILNSQAYVDNLKSEVAALTRQLADEKARTKRVAEMAAADGWDNGECVGKNRYDKSARRHIDIGICVERALACA